MNWQTCIAEKTVGALRRFGHALASIAAYRRPRRWADFAVMALLAVGIGLVSMWAGAVVLFIAVALFMRREAPAQPAHQVSGKEPEIDTSWDELWDTPGRRHATMTHEHAYRAFEDDQ